MNKKSKGFTLVELLGVIVLLALIGALTYPTVTKIVRQGKEQVTETNIDTIFDAAYNWTIKNTGAIPKVKDQSISITVSRLKQEGYLDVNVKEANDLENIPNDSLITITKDKEQPDASDYKFYNNYMFEFTKGESDEKYSLKSPVITLNGNATEYVELDSTNSNNYIDLGATAKSYNNADLTSVIDKSIYLGSNETGIIDTNRLQSYRIKYSVKDSMGNSSSVYRTVIIKDTTVPTFDTFPTITNISLPVDLNSNILNATCIDNSGKCEITKTLIANDTLKVGNRIIIVYTATDSSGNRREQRLVLTINS